MSVFKLIFNLCAQVQQMQFKNKNLIKRTLKLLFQIITLKLIHK